MKYYDNPVAAPMIICLFCGLFFLAAGTYGDSNVYSNVCYIIGWIFLGIFVILKIANWAVAKNEQSQALDEVKNKIKDLYNNLLNQGVTPWTARLSIAEDLQKRYKSGDIDVGICNKLIKYVMKEM